MARSLFRPTTREAAVLGVTALLALGFALAMRYLAIENTPLGLACDAGDSRFVCTARKTVLAFSQATLFGGVALGAALMNMIRPSLALCGIALAGAGMGLVLYNTSLSAVAIAVLAFSLARPVPEPE